MKKPMEGRGLEAQLPTGRGEVFSSPGQKNPDFIAKYQYNLKRA